MRRIVLTGLATCFVLGAIVACSGDTTLPPLGPAGGLEAATGSDWVLVFHPELGTLQFAMPKGPTRPITDGKDSTAAALALLASHRDLFRIDVRDVTPERVIVDDRGHTHVTFAQSVGGVPVHGARITVHLTKDGTVSYINGMWAPAADGVHTKPSVPEAAAVSAATARLKVRYPSFDGSWLDAPPPTALRIVLEGGAPRLVYEVLFPLMLAGAELRYTVDATSGIVLRETDELLRVAATGKGVRAYAIDSRRASDVKAFEVEGSAGTYSLHRSAANGVPELSVLRFGFRGKQQQNRPLTSSDPNAWDTTGRGPGSGVDAYVNMTKVDAFFKKLGRSSFDDRGARLDVVVHQWDGEDSFEWGKNDRFMCNAFWSPYYRMMAFGDGDYRKPGNDGSGCMPLSGSLDIVAHEYTHAIVSTELGLDYAGEAAALNESLADIFGAFVEHAEAPNDTNNVRFLEDGLVGLSLAPMRDMQNPKNGTEWAGAPAHVSELPSSQMESHFGSNVPSHAFYLMTFGGTNAVSGIQVEGGIGWDRALSLYYSVLTTSRMSASATFKDWAMATVADAKTRGIEPAPVVCAWRAVGVFSKEEAEGFATTCLERGDGGPSAQPSDAGRPDVDLGESCSGRADGIYCSVLHPYGAMVCKDGGIAYGLQCPTPQLCVGPNGPGTAIQCQ